MGSLGMLLYLMLQDLPKKSIGVTPAPAGMNTRPLMNMAPGALQSTPYGSQDPIQLLMNIFGGMGGVGGAPGLI